MKWQIYLQHLIVVMCIAATSTNAADVTDQELRRNSSINIEAMASRSAARFAKIDTNGNGQIDTAEFAAIEMKRPHRAKQGKRPHRAKQGKRPHRAKPGKRPHRAKPGKRPHRAKPGFSRGGPHDGFRRGHQRLPNPDAVFDMADEDADGQLSRKEFKLLPAKIKKVVQKPLFSRLDVNDDGALTEDEFPRSATRLKKLDANGDGELTRDEIPARN
jgi:Ca2+-binding EF-hand superfamily protein